MNKTKKVILSILGGTDVFIRIATPIMLVWLWLAIFGIEGNWTSYVFIFIGICASLFRAIKIGWIKHD